MSSTTGKPEDSTAVLSQHDRMYEVILHNDDQNTMLHVVSALMRVFGHPHLLAVKIMLEAHEQGLAIAEIESESAARLHRDQLQSLSLTATIEVV